jgi:hypothetical protein
MTTVSSLNSSGVSGTSGNAALVQIKTDLAAALNAAGLTSASASDASPMGFPTGVSWSEAYKMVVQRKEDSNSATPGTLVLSASLLKKTIAATQTLKDLGHPNLSRFPRGTSVLSAIEALFQNKANGILASTLAKAGIYDLSSFPTGTTAYQAFKLIEDPESPGKISLTRYKALKEAYSALNALGIKSLDSFPRGTTTLEAKAILEPKAATMLSMVGVSASYFKDPTISSLKALSILTNLPNSIREMNPLPAGTTSANLGAQANAAKKLVAMGYDSLSSFASMTAFSGKAVTATEALAQAMKIPAPVDLPLATSDNVERLFKNPDPAKIINFGAANPMKLTVYTARDEDKLKARTVPATIIVNASDVLAANALYWAKK